jgi:hypothetical protein
MTEYDILSLSVPMSEDASVCDVSKSMGQQ